MNIAIGGDSWGVREWSDSEDIHRGMWQYFEEDGHKVDMSAIPGECNNITSPSCYNTPPTDINCETEIRKRYNFNHNKFKTESCVKSSDRISFKKEPVSYIDNINKYPNTQRTIELLNTINSGVKYDYYKFFNDTKCMNFPAERLFNNNTSRKSTPNHHNIYNIQPKHLA